MIKEQKPDALREPIGVLGYGVEGVSTCRFLLNKGYSDITVFDRKQPENLDPRLKFGGSDGLESPDGYLGGLGKMNTLFRSAGVRPDLAEIREFTAKGGLLTSQIGLAFSLAGRDRIIGVTGTLGKGTCCSLLKAILDEAGILAKLGGNIGVPALDLADSLGDDEWLLLELSSFQLSTLWTSPAVAAVLKTTSEHLDWHLSQDEYWLHKANLVAAQTPDDFLAYCADAAGSAWIALQSPARKAAYGHAHAGKREASGRAGAQAQTKAPDVLIANGAVTWVTRGLTIPLSDTRLTGEFNLENLAAAGSIALELGASPEHVRAAAAKFQGLEHRLEFVRELDGIRYYNDSYATRPEASMGAVAALASAPLGLILGGSDKHADFGELVAAILDAPHVKAVALIGQTALRLQSELQAGMEIRAGEKSRGSEPAPSQLGKPAMRLCASLEDAVAWLLASVGKGAIALSPACASFGMFENYKERGKAFKRLIHGLQSAT